MEPIKIPTEIDSPHQILFWSTDEFVPFMICFILGHCIGQLLPFCIVGAVIGHFYKRYKNTRPNGYLNHLLYWYGLSGIFKAKKGITMLNPYIKELFP